MIPYSERENVHLGENNVCSKFRKSFSRSDCFTSKNLQTERNHKMQAFREMSHAFLFPYSTSQNVHWRETNGGDHCVKSINRSSALTKLHQRTHTGKTPMYEIGVEEPSGGVLALSDTEVLILRGRTLGIGSMWQAFNYGYHLIWHQEIHIRYRNSLNITW